MCRKLQRTDPKLIHEKVSPSETVLEGRVQVQPLTYILKPFTLPDEAPTGALICESAAAVAVGDLAANTTFEVEVGGKARSMTVLPTPTIQRPSLGLVT